MRAGTMTDWADNITLAVLKYFDSDDQEFSDNLKSYITQALGEEREACAKVADNNRHFTYVGGEKVFIGNQIAKAIRSRGDR